MNKKKLLEAVQSVIPGTTRKTTITQSDCLIFTEKELIAFNGQIGIRTRNPLDEINETTVVPAHDFLKVLEKFPDEEIEIEITSEEIIIRGERKSAGIKIHVNPPDVPSDSLPRPKGLQDMPEGLQDRLMQAAMVCSRNSAKVLTTCVHVSSDFVEACDDSRLYRSDFETGFEKELMIPAEVLLPFQKNVFEQYAIGNDWIHFVDSSGLSISICCFNIEYPDFVEIIEFDGDVAKLPSSLADIIERSKVMRESDFVQITLTKDLATVHTRKETGWFKERKRIRYSGRPVSFDVNPEFFLDVLSRGRKVLIGKHRMKIETSTYVFLVGLRISEKE